MFKVIWKSKRVIGFTFTLLVADDESELVLILVVSIDNSEAILRAVSVFFVKGMNIEYLPKKWSVENKCCSDTVVGENVEVAEYGGV